MRMMKTMGPAIAGLLLYAGAAMADTLPALYTAAQAKAGVAVYAQNCAMCHGADLKGMAGPSLLGAAFAPAGGGSTVGSVFSMVAQQMPAGAPGSLTPAEYENVMAYLLQANGYPAGAKPLVYKDSLASTAPLVSQVK